MKRTLLLSLLMLAGKNLWAQIAPPPQPICGIYYDYDAVGQRIKRSYDCRTKGSDEIPYSPDKKVNPPAPQTQARKSPTTDLVLASQATTIKVYPNPTAGQYTIALSEAPKEPVHYHWYSERGQILGSGTIDAQTVTGNIAYWADGVYLLQVYLPAGTESFRVVKITGGQ